MILGGETFESGCGSFLNKVWKEITTIYAKESKRINEFKVKASCKLEFTITFE